MKWLITRERVFDDNSNMESDSDFIHISTNSMIQVILNLILGYLRPSEAEML